MNAVAVIVTSIIAATETIILAGALYTLGRERARTQEMGALLHEVAASPLLRLATRVEDALKQEGVVFANVTTDGSGGYLVEAYKSSEQFDEETDW